jgi:hypothetical protein
MESNQPPPGYESGAPPSELRGQKLIRATTSATVPPDVERDTLLRLQGGDLGHHPYPCRRSWSPIGGFAPRFPGYRPGDHLPIVIGRKWCRPEELHLAPRPYPRTRSATRTWKAMNGTLGAIRTLAACLRRACSVHRPGCVIGTLDWSRTNKGGVRSTTCVHRRGYEW